MSIENEPYIQVCSFLFADVEIRASERIGGLDFLLRQKGFDVSKPYTIEDRGNGIHMARQEVLIQEYQHKYTPATEE